MAVTLEIISIPIGSQYTQAIGTDDPESLNDFRVLIIADENGTGLQESDITLSTGASLVELTGDGVTREATIRPPETAGMLTLTVGVDAFSEGNAETSKDIRLSTSFPDADAEVPTELFTGANYRAYGLTVSPNRIITSAVTEIRFFDFDGTLQTGETLTGQSVSLLEYFNNTLLITRNNLAPRRYPINSTTLLDTLPLGNNNASTVPTAYGFLQARANNPFYLLPYGGSASDRTEIEEGPDLLNNSKMAHQGGLLFIVSFLNRKDTRV